MFTRSGFMKKLNATVIGKGLDPRSTGVEWIGKERRASII